METVEHATDTRPSLTTLPGDDIRQILWGFADRFDIQMLVQSVRPVARGQVARLVADGGRHTHDWTDAKNDLLASFDAAGVTALFADPEYGGFIEGPKNLALALAAFELAWVDGGAATCSLAGHLALAPIHEKGTEEQKRTYMSRAIPGQSEEVARGAFCLTEPLPFVGVDTRVLSGRVRIEGWNDGEEPMLRVEKRGRFITNMGFANFVTAAVESDDERLKGTCMVILEESDPGTFDRGSATHKLVHQLSSTTDPIFNLVVPASRIIGGYTLKDGVIVPNYNHSQIIEAVFRRTRVTVGLMTAAKMLSAVEPVIRYQRSRFRGGAADAPGSPATTSDSSRRKTPCTVSSTFGPLAKRPLRSDSRPRNSSTSSTRSITGATTSSVKAESRTDGPDSRCSRRSAVPPWSISGCGRWGLENAMKPVSRSWRRTTSRSSSYRMRSPSSSALPSNSGTPATERT